MNETSEERPSEASQKVTRWTRRYAQSRGGGPVLIVLAAMGCVWGAIMVSSLGLGWAGLTGHYLLFCFCVVVLITALGFNTWLSVPKWGGRWLHRLGWRYYDHEGSVNIALNTSPKRMKRMKQIELVVAFLFIGAILTHMLLLFWGYTSDKMMQPISALYVVPFSLFIALLSRTYLSLLFPALYSLHAVLLLAGVPLRLWSVPAMDTMIVPMGYMAFTAIIMHLYNRYALARLKRAVCTLDVGESK